MRTISALQPALAFAFAVVLWPAPVTAEAGTVTEGTPPASGDSETALQISGSFLNESGFIGLRSALPDAAAADWYSLSSASARLSLEDGAASFFAKLWGRFDAATGAWTLSLDEAWYEWHAVTAVTAGTVTGAKGIEGRELDLRLGRSLLAFGPCLAFGPANPFIAKDGFDPRASQVGLDGLFLELVLPLSAPGRDSFLSLNARAAFLLPSAGFLPTASLPMTAGPPDLGDSSAHGRLTLFAPGGGILGPLEFGLVSDLHRVGFAAEGASDWDVGGWFGTELAGFVFGAEAAIRTSSQGYAFSLNRRMGDFFVIAEADYEETRAAWLGFGRVSWAAEEREVSLSALFDFGTEALRASLVAARNLGDSFTLSASLGWNRFPEKWESPLPADWTAGLALECFF
ncbi:MAG TPA: hypothetical protein VMV83_02835 [Rectinemataceae bacterium]|nr:hypothetical protein [Rectinemataceae bacterium]